MGSGVDSPNSPEFAEIVVIRHGETTWNASRIAQGQLDSELTVVGKQQAFAVADRLSKERKFAAIYSSDLKRAAETAKIIASSCKLSEVVLDLTLRERHLGDIQGLTLSDAAKLKPKAYQQFCSAKTDQEIEVVLDPTLRERRFGDIQGLTLSDAAKLKPTPEYIDHVYSLVN